MTGPLDDVVCPPYDVITEEERADLVRRNPYNVVRVELPQGDYAGAARLLGEWHRTGAFARDERPALYGYRMTYKTAEGPERQTLGVLGALALEPPGHGILPHEQTTPKAKSDRLELLRATRTNTSPIWCLCSQPGLTSAIEAATPAGSASAVAVDDEGTRHELWPIPDQSAVRAVAGVVAGAPLLVADGHHRYETALGYQAETGTGAAVGAGGAASVLSLVVELSEQHLAVGAIHRAIAGLPAGFDLIGALGPYFELAPVTGAGAALFRNMSDRGALAVVARTGTWLAFPRPGTLAGPYELDSSRADAVLATLPPHALTYEHDAAAAARNVTMGRYDAVVFCRPATVEQIARTARGAERMPPKTTFFWPKPRTGMVFRLLD